MLLASSKLAKSAALLTLSTIRTWPMMLKIFCTKLVLLQLASVASGSDLLHGTEDVLRRYFHPRFRVHRLRLLQSPQVACQGHWGKIAVLYAWHTRLSVALQREILHASSKLAKSAALLTLLAIRTWR